MLLDGKRVVSCLTLAAQCDGRAVTTIEGLAGDDGGLHPMQEAFIRHDAFQCGCCTPGQILSAVSLLAEGRAGSDEEIKEFMSGNLCRCGAYQNIRRRDPRGRAGAGRVAMRPFAYTRAPTPPRPSRLVSRDPDAAYLAGGTTQVDLMLKDGIVEPRRLVDITRLPLRGITRGERRCASER